MDLVILPIVIAPMDIQDTGTGITPAATTVTTVGIRTEHITPVAVRTTTVIVITGTISVTTDIKAAGFV